MSLGDLRQNVFRIPAHVVVSVGLQWNFIGADPVDLDLSATCFTREGRFLDVVFFNHLFPTDTDEEALRSEWVVDVAQLPYVFLSGDSTMGGEEENHLPSAALAERRGRERRAAHGLRGRARDGAVGRFDQRYDEEELRGIEAAACRGDGRSDVEAASLPRPRGLSDEVLTFVLHKIPRETEVIFLTVTSYTGVDFTVPSFVRLVIDNETTNVRVGTMDLRSSTRDGTANLAAMLLRVPGEAAAAAAETSYWDLRELNLRTFGYTFVDLLPRMFDIMGVDAASRPYALQSLPDYPLHKRRAPEDAAAPLSDLRLGVGWDGPHDVDAFLVCFDAEGNYWDHLHPKDGRRHALLPHLAQHSGDARDGHSTVGDDECIDLLAYRLPPEVHTVVLGATYAGGGDPAASLHEVPRLYLRLQHRPLARPDALEVSRWNVFETPAGGAPARHYAGPDGTLHPVRLLVLGVLRRGGELPAAAWLAGAGSEAHAPADLAERLPLFDFLPVREGLPGDPRPGFAAVLPRLRGLAQRLTSTTTTTTITTGVHLLPPPSSPPRTSVAGGPSEGLDFLHHLPGWEARRGTGRPPPVSSPSPPLGRGGGDGHPLAAGPAATAYAAVRVEFVRVLALAPVLPDRFRCHAAAWVSGTVHRWDRARPVPADAPRAFQTPFLVHPSDLSWDPASPASAVVFVVHPDDRIRVVLYEWSAFGHAEVDLRAYPGLCDPAASGTSPVVDLRLELRGGGHLSKAMLHLRLRPAALPAALQQMKRAADAHNARRARWTKEQRQQLEGRQNRQYHPCSVL